MGVAGLVYQSSPFDPVVFGGAVALLVGAALTATLIPARRARKVQPTTALRTE